ncbi:MAG: hypothetical protein L3J23_07900 [Flavobacteriaceae bacterium]|nr:hypothetical protein [Flavobacteriaceae bacterium]
MFSFFGISTKINLKNSPYKAILLDELLVYKTEIRDTKIEITDNWSSFNSKLIANNPSQYYYYKDAIRFKDKLTEVAFVFDKNNQLKKIYFRLHIAPNYFRKVIRKWLNMQFTNRVENIGQIFHENILIPMTFFFDDLVPIHASGFSLNGKSILLGGTGGTGKTTLELEFCLHKNAGFITDDIAIINQNNEVYPNYNHPKIYGYNLVGNNKLKNRIFKKESFFSKIHWFLHRKIFGISKVRRKVSPFDLFENVKTEKTKLKNYYILSKNDCIEVSKEKLNLETICKMTVEIVFTEYNYFFNQLKWHEFNALSKKNKPIITTNDLEKKWITILNKSLTKTENYLVNIPLSITHKEFKKQINSLPFGKG